LDGQENGVWADIGCVIHAALQFRVTKRQERRLVAGVPSQGHLLLAQRGQTLLSKVIQFGFKISCVPLL
jgi:hypothetical protein